MILILAIIAWLCWAFIPTLWKKSIADYYGIDKRPMKKWIQYFCPPHLYELWTNNKIRQLTGLEFEEILNYLGDPDETPVMNKDQIAEACESDTKTLRREILSKLEKLGLSKEAYDNLSVFPPFMIARLVAAM